MSAQPCRICGRPLTGDGVDHCRQQHLACGARDREIRASPVRLVLPYPISENRYWASRVIRVKATGKWMSMTYVTPEAEAYRQQVGLLALQAGVRKPITGRALITLDLYPHRPLDWAKRARKDPDGWADTVQCIDLGNSEKVLCDALNAIAWLDDKQLWDIHKRKHEPDDHGARVVVTIEPIVRQAIAPGLFDAGLSA